MKFSSLLLSTASMALTAQAESYTILDSWTEMVPTGSGLEELEDYQKYESNSPAVFWCRHGNDRECIHFYGALHIATTKPWWVGEPETARMEMKGGKCLDGKCFDLKQFKMQLQDWGAECGEAPYVTITASNGFKKTYTGTCEWRRHIEDGSDCTEQCLDWTFYIGGMVQFNGLSTVEWVDFTVSKTKLKITDLTFNTVDCPRPTCPKHDIVKTISPETCWGRCTQYFTGEFLRIDPWARHYVCKQHKKSESDQYCDNGGWPSDDCNEWWGNHDHICYKDCRRCNPAYGRRLEERESELPAPDAQH